MRADDDTALGVTRREFALRAGAILLGAWALPVAAPVLARASELAAADPTPRVLSAAEWRVVDAIAARILPGDAAGGGAREAGCVNFVDKLLAAEGGEGVALYRDALAEIERLCREAHDAGFAALSESHQDAFLGDLETASVPGWRAAGGDAAAFFAAIRMHVILGFVLDPAHGGNRDHVGWKAMGFPGPVHHMGGATAAQMRGDVPFAPIWERRTGDDGHRHGADTQDARDPTSARAGKERKKR